MKKNENNEKSVPIDIFLTWVDGNDEKWLKKRCKYDSSASMDSGVERYRNWDNFKYVFRGIEKNMPWVNKIFLVTDNQKPDFLNESNPRLKIISHADYMPKEYLPTFNSNTIEMNAFRIEEMSENFILFNDDCFPIDFMPKEYFFCNGLPCDEAVERIIAPWTCDFTHRMVNNAGIINRHFNKKLVKRKNWIKWYSYKYGCGQILRNIILNYFNAFEGLRIFHEPMLLKKSTMKKVWDAEPELLDRTSRNKFRNMDVSWYAVRYWQVFEGEFYPRKHKGKPYLLNNANFLDVADDIRTKKYPIMSIDEVPGSMQRFDEAKMAINSALESVLPDKCSFEK